MPNFEIFRPHLRVVRDTDYGPVTEWRVLPRGTAVLRSPQSRLLDQPTQTYEFDIIKHVERDGTLQFIGYVAANVESREPPLSLFRKVGIRPSVIKPKLVVTNDLGQQQLRGGRPLDRLSSDPRVILREQVAPAVPLLLSEQGRLVGGQPWATTELAICGDGSIKVSVLRGAGVLIHAVWPNPMPSVAPLLPEA